MVEQDFNVDQDFKIPPSPCPYCGHELNGASGMAEPQEGDATICLECNSITIFGEGLRLRKPNDEEIKALAGDPRVLTVMKAIGMVKVESERVTTEEG